MKNISILIALFFLCISHANAQLSYFDCIGESQNFNSGRRESERFDMTASINPPQIIAPAGILGCLSLDKKNKITQTCNVNDSQIICACKGGDYATGTAYLSRINGQLNIVSIHNKTLYHGEYKCTKINKKLL
jgi:hypothetical protein